MAIVSCIQSVIVSDVRSVIGSDDNLWRIGPSLDLNFADTFSPSQSLDLDFSDNLFRAWTTNADGVEGSYKLKKNTMKFSDLITFTRSSAATRANSSGFIEYAPENLLTYSEQFDNAAWGKGSSTVTANQTIAPDGTSAADLFLESAANAYHQIYNGFSPTTSTLYTFSTYIKSAGRNVIAVAFTGTAFTGNQVYCFFDLSNGIVGTNYGTTNPQITNVGNGWYRCQISTTTLSTSGSAQVFFTTSLDNSTTLYTGNPALGYYVWGAQLERATYARAYAKTTSAAYYGPRIDFDPATQDPKGFLVEEQRTNLLTYSEQFDNAVWTKTNSTITANAIIAPNGTLTADKLVESAANALHETSQGTTVSGTTYSFSVYAKAAERNQIQLSGMGAEGQGLFTNYNLANGTFSGATAGSSITAVGNGWYKCVFVLTASNTNAPSIRLRDTSGNNLYTGDGTSGVYIWGAQLEAGAFATSYIPTAASQVTRAADVASVTGANFASWYRQSEGTFVVEANVGGGTFPYAFGVTDGTTANRIIIYRQSSPATTSSNFDVRIDNGSVNQASISLAGSSTKIALAYKANDIAATANGAAAITDSFASIPTLTTLQIGGYQGLYFANGWIKRITYYPHRLTNAELQALTA